MNNGKCKCDCINTLAVELTPDRTIPGLICITNMRMVPFPVDSNSFKDKLFGLGLDQEEGAFYSICIIHKQ